MYRERANRALLIALVLFGAATALRCNYRDAIWAQALFRMAEAALVGGVADWFAVTALFRRPLGISFHTALIPRNRHKIIRAVTHMVEEELLSKQSILRHLRQVRMVALFISWMDGGGKAAVFRLLTKATDQWVQDADRAQLAATLAKAIRERLQTVKPQTCATVISQWLEGSGKANQLLDLLVAEARQYADRPALRQEIYRLLENTAREATGQSTLGRLFGAFLQTFDFINLEEAATTLQQRLQAELVELERTDHPLRVWLYDRLLQSLRELETNDEWQAGVQAWQAGLIERMPLEMFLQPLVDRLLQPAAGVGQSGERPLVEAISRFAEVYWQEFCHDLTLQDWLERRLQEAAAEVASSEHKLIGEVVAQALSSLTDAELNAFIEDKFGEDLAWIRINGSVVGALAGLVVFFIGQYVYLPYVWPWLQAVWR